MNILQFIQKFGGTSDYDVQGHIHGYLGYRSGNKAAERRYQKILNKLITERDQTEERFKEYLKEHPELCEKELTTIERLKLTAKGDPNLKSTQAAKRALVRREMRAAHENNV